MTTTREQRLLELVERWRDLRHQNDDEYGLYGTYTYQAAEQCARELAAILNEPVEVSEDFAGALSQLRQAVSVVLEGWTLAPDARKLLETAVWNPGALTMNNDVPDERPKRYVVLKASGSRYAYVNDTFEGKTVKRYDVLKGDGWEHAAKHAKSLNDALKEPGQ